MGKEVKSISDLVGEIRPFWEKGWRIKRLCKKKDKSCYDINKVNLISPDKRIFNWEDLSNPGYSEFDREEINSAYTLFYVIKDYFNNKIGEKRKYSFKT